MEVHDEDQGHARDWVAASYVASLPDHRTLLRGGGGRGAPHWVGNLSISGTREKLGNCTDVMVTGPHGNTTACGIAGGWIFGSVNDMLLVFLRPNRASETRSWCHMHRAVRRLPEVCDTELHVNPIVAMAAATLWHHGAATLGRRCYQTWPAWVPSTAPAGRDGRHAAERKAVAFCTLHAPVTSPVIVHLARERELPSGERACYVTGGR